MEKTPLFPQELIVYSEALAASLGKFERLAVSDLLQKIKDIVVFYSQTLMITESYNLTRLEHLAYSF